MDQTVRLWLMDAGRQKRCGMEGENVKAYGRLPPSAHQAELYSPQKDYYITRIKFNFSTRF